MFQFSNKAKRFSWILIVIGAISLVLNFTTGGGQHEDVSHSTHSEVQHDDHAGTVADDGHHQEEAHAAHGEEHAHHSLADNKPWSRILHTSFFFMAVALGALFFLAIQYAAQAGWSATSLRIMEAVASFLPIPLIVLFILAVLGVMHVHHIWHWMAEGIMDPESSNYDAIIAGKEGYLNPVFFLVRIVIYIVGWLWAARSLRSLSLKSDTVGSIEESWVIWKKSRRNSAIFLVFFAVTSSMMAWDFIMSIDTHWFSTLFGWYTFAGLFVSAVTAITLIAIYLKMNGYLPELNQNHLQDLGKFMFAFSIFWTYLWFSQYMLIWYSNIPEEVTYYMIRFEEYGFPFMAMLAMNFLFPILIIMSRDSKRNQYFILTAGIIILFGHWMDHFVMIMPGSVGVDWSFGLIDLGIFALYLGVFIQVVFRALEKAPLLHKNHPMLHESKLHHI
jgi:hypothetical protein